MANTTWNPLDKTANITLSNGNLTATAPGPGSQGVRAVDSQAAGKFYFEVTAVSIGSSCGAGLANAAAPLGNTSMSGGTCLIINAGFIYVSGTFTGVSLSTISNGNIVGIAVDLTGALIWFRVAPSGSWNANAGYTPGGTGGIGIAAVSGGAFPYALINGGGEAWTANFGGTAFSGAVPGGFTSGWTAGGSGGGGAAQARALVLA